MDLSCPKCKAGSNLLKENGTLFYERGWFYGDKYEEEGDAQVYCCTVCSFRFAVLD